MGIGAIVAWTKSKLSQLGAEHVSVRCGAALRGVTGGVAVPSLDLFENEHEYRVVLDAPGATAANTRLTWNEVDALLVHVQRATTMPGTPLVCEYQETDWYQEVVLPADAHGAKASAELRQGVLTISVPKQLTLSAELLPAYAA